MSNVVVLNSCFSTSIRNIFLLKIHVNCNTICVMNQGHSLTYLLVNE